MIQYSNNIRKEGYIPITISTIITLILILLNPILGFIGFIVSILLIYFFRNPVRCIPQGDNFILAPADGIIQSISEAEPPIELKLKEKKMLKISIITNILNVSINRIPSNGKVLSLHYSSGKFTTLYNTNTIKMYEKQSISILTKNFNEIVIVQIGHFITKQIICDLEEETNVIIGSKYGMIKFGGQVDIYIPYDTNILVTEGYTCIAGETVLADFFNKNNITFIKD